MNVWSFLKLLKLRHLWSLFRLCAGHFWFVWPTVKATKRCIKISNRNYGQLHHKNTPANAFRHAIWNYLIAQECFRWNKNEQKVIDWAKKITDWHEEFSPNDALAKDMDFHNNAVGRKLFLQYKSISDGNMVSLLKEMTVASIKITRLEEIKKLPKNQLTHIVDFPDS